ncbi:MAG: RNA polymerase sigma factor [Verrucomicrobia bacterium]|nr:RNA polymerase sigma factor [Verrucomicrobiota bacterium]
MDDRGHIPTDPRTDQALIAAINAGDAAAFDALYLRHRDWVVSLAFRFTGDRDLALDVLQETFLYVLKKFPGFRLTAQFTTFLYPAVKNLSLAARRKAERLQSSEAEQGAMETVLVTGPVSHEGEALAAALAGLSEEHREVLLLRFVDGLSLAEIAGALDVPLGTVKSRLHNALGTLRRDERTRSLFET